MFCYYYFPKTYSVIILDTEIEKRKKSTTEGESLELWRRIDDAVSIVTMVTIYLVDFRDRAMQTFNNGIYGLYISCIHSNVYSACIFVNLLRCHP